MAIRNSGAVTVERFAPLGRHQAELATGARNRWSECAIGPGNLVPGTKPNSLM